MFDSGLWGLATVIGPFVLLVVFIWVIVRNRQSRVPKDVTEAATDQLYRDEDRASKARDGNDGI